VTPAPEPPAWLDELDLHVGPPDATLGARALDLADWLVVDDDWEPQRAAAAELVRTARDEVVVGIDDPAVLGPSEELLALVRERTPARSGTPIPAHAGESARQNDGMVEHPLVDARLLVADDLCVLLPDGARWVLAAGCTCFPSYWRPRDKVGRPLAVVFGIRTQQLPLGALAGRPDTCRALAAALRGWSPAQRAYKGHAVDDSVLRWLDAAG